MKVLYTRRSQNPFSAVTKLFSSYIGYTIKTVAVLAFFFVFSHSSMAQTYLTLSTNQKLSGNVIYTGASISSSAILTIETGAVVTFTGPVEFLNSASLIVENGATLIINGKLTIDGSATVITAANSKLIVTTGGLLLDNNSEVTFNGSVAIRGGGLRVNSNAQISFDGVAMDTIVGGATFENNSDTNVGYFTNLYINGNVTATNNFSIVSNGVTNINGNYHSSNNGGITGAGDVTTTGSFIATGNSTVFGQNPFSCASGCSGQTSCGYSNTIHTLSQTYCSGTLILDASSIAGATTYTWQSTTNLSNAFVSAAGTNNAQKYTLTSLASTTYYRRKVVSGGCTDYSSVITITKGVTGTPSVSIVASANNVCAGTSIKFTASPVNGGVPAYQWRKNGVNIVGAVYSTYITTDLTNGNIITCALTVTNSCIATTSALSTGITMIINTPAVPTVTTPVTYCQNATATALTASGTGLSWTTTSGATGTATAPTPVTTSTGTTTYYVTQTVSGCKSAQASIQVVVNANPASPAVTTPVTYCQNATATALTATGTGLLWTTTSGATGTAAVPTPVTTSTGTTTYYVTQTANGCKSAQASIAVVINARPTILLTAQPGASTCVDEAVTYTTSSGQSNYIWTIPGISNTDYIITSGGTINSNTITLKWMTTGSKSLTVNYTQANGCNAATAKASNATAVNICLRTWTGATSTAWATSTNWSPASIPTSVNDVLIPATTRKPIVSSTANVRTITIEPSCSLTVAASGTLNVNGNIANSGTLTTNSGSAIAMTGFVAQTITNVPQVHSLKINNAAGVTITSSLLLKESLYLPLGTLTTGNFLSIDFNAGGNIAYTSGDQGAVSGKVTVFRDAVAAKTHYIASPLDNVPFSDLADDAEIINPSNGNSRLFVSKFETQTWTQEKTMTNSFQAGKAYSMFFTAATTIDFTGDYTHIKNYSTGAYPNASVQYILVANPYPSSLDWDNTAGWTKTNIKDAVYYWNPATTSYASYVGGMSVNGGSQYIPAMNAFFVATTGANGASELNIHNSARSTQKKSMFRTASDPFLRLTVTGTEVSDETVIRFNDQATAGFDNNLDAYKMMNATPTPSIYTSMNTSKYSINSLSDPASYPAIPVSVKIPADGTYSLTFANSTPGTTYMLIDKLLQTETLLSGQAIEFSAKKTDNADRFELVLKALEVSNPVDTTPVVTTPDITTPTTNQTAGSESVKLYSSQGGCMVFTTEFAGKQGTIEVMDVNGQTVALVRNIALEQGGTFVRLDNLPSGTYFVKMTVEGLTTSAQVTLLK